MKQKDLQKLITQVETDEQKFVNQLRTDGQLALNIMYLIGMVLKFINEHGYDSKGNRKRITFWRVLFSKAMRQGFGKILDKVIDIFKPSDNE